MYSYEVLHIFGQHMRYHLQWTCAIKRDLILNPINIGNSLSNFYTPYVAYLLNWKKKKEIYTWTNGGDWSITMSLLIGLWQYRNMKGDLGLLIVVWSC